MSFTCPLSDFNRRDFNSQKQAKKELNSRRKLMMNNELRSANGKLFCKHFIRNGERILQTKNCEMPVRELILQLVALTRSTTSEEINLQSSHS